MQLELGGQGYIEYLNLNMESYRALESTHFWLSQPHCSLLCTMGSISEDKSHSLHFPGFSTRFLFYFCELARPGSCALFSFYHISWALSPTAWQLSPLSVGCKVFSGTVFIQEHTLVSNIPQLTHYFLLFNHGNTLKSQRNTCSLWSCFLCPGNCLTPSL